MALQTDTGVLAKEAANFERIAGELKNAIARVEQTAADLDSHWQGAAAKAAQGAIIRFQQAAAAQVQQLNEISTNVQTASALYGTTDNERAGSLAAAMSLGGPRANAHSHADTSAPQGAQISPATAATAGNGKRTGVQMVDFKQNGGEQPPPHPGFIDQYEKELASPGPQLAPAPIPMPSSGNARPPGTPQAPGPLPAYTPPPPFGQCVEEHVHDSIGKEMIKDAFKSAAEKAGLGAAAGAGLTPEMGGAGAIPGGVLGWVGGFTQGLIEAPVEAAAKGAWECLDEPLPGGEK